MPPPRPRPDVDPMDPFPPLLSGRRPMNDIPTYASILRPHHNRPSGSNGGNEPSEGREPGAWDANTRMGSNGWDVDDVDPQDALDEIRSYPTSPAVAGGSSPRPNLNEGGQARPPWRAREIPTTTDTGMNPERVGGGEGEGSGSGSGSGAATRVEEGIERLPEPAERHPELGSVISPSSAHFPSTTQPTTRLAPIFTLDELLGQNAQPTQTQPEQHEQNETARERDTAPAPRSDPIPIPSTSDPIPQQTPAERAAAARRRLMARPLSAALSSEIESARRTWQGGIEAAERLGYDPTLPGAGGSRGDNRDRRPITLTYPPPRDDIAVNSSTVIIPLRRRGRNFAPEPPTGMNAPLGEEVELDDEDIQFWTSLAAPMSGTARQHVFPENARDPTEPRLLDLARRITRPFYSHPNLTGDIDLDEWSGAFGPGSVLGAGTGAGAGTGPLRRGGNNRRRDSLQQRIDPGRDSSTGAEEVMPLLTDSGTSQGLEPTNMESLSLHQPTIVRTVSNGTRRQRSASDGSVPERRTRFPKRRKVPTTNSTDTSLPPARPAYLSITSLSSSTPLPDDFDKPTKKSFLHLSHSTTGRSLIKFCDGPRVTETDDDACALRANRAIPVECGVYYYEVECINAGMEGFMSVGWMLKSAGLQRLVGWDKGTWGWHADDGMSFNQSGSGDQFAEKWSIGCGVDFTSGRAFFTKNGRMMGHRFSNLGRGLHPAIGLRSRDEELCVNFTGPFRFDIEAYMREARDNAEVDVNNHVPGPDRVCRLGGDASTKPNDESEDKDGDGDQDGDIEMKSSKSASAGEAAIDTPSKPKPKAPSLPAKDRMTAAFVLDYLKHHGHTTALESTRSEMIRRSWIPTPIGSPYKSKSKSEIEVDGKLAKINEVNRLLAIPGSTIPIDKIRELLPPTSTLMHRMTVYHLVQSIQEARSNDDDEDGDSEKEMEAIKLGRDTLRDARALPWGSAEMDLLDEAFGLLALELDEEGKKRWSERRQRDSDLLDSHLRSVHELPVRSKLLEAIGQTSAVNSWLARNGTASATFLSVRQSLGLDSRTGIDVESKQD